MRAKSVTFSILALLILVAPAVAAPPPAPQLLPQRTLAYFRINNCSQLSKDFGKTAFGKLFKDPKIRPLIADLYKQVEDAFKQIEQQIGVSLTQIMKLPQGELSVALVAPQQGDMGLVMNLDVGTQLPAAKKLLKLFDNGVKFGGYKTSTEKAGNISLTVHRKPDAGFFKELVIFDRDKTIYFVTDLELAKQMLKVWDGAKFDTFASNKQFTTIMKKSLGTKEERPQVTFFVDPIEIVKVVGKDNFGMQLVIAAFPQLGLDGLKGIGGSIIMGAEEFDSIMHLHILTEGKRKGILDMIALEPGDITPERFVPADVASYFSMNWDFQKTYNLIAQTVDSYQGQGQTAKNLRDQVSPALGVDVEKDVLGQLGKRFTMMSWVAERGKVNGAAAFYAIEVKDGKAAKATMDKIVNKVGNNRVKQSRFGGISIYQVDLDIREGRLNPELMRKPEICFAVMNNYVVFSDSLKFMQHVIRRNNGRGKNLVADLDFKLIQNQIGQQTKTKKPAMIIFSRPGPVLESFYEMAAKEEKRKAWATPREGQGPRGGQRLLSVLDGALTKNPLPPFKHIEKYFATGGALISVDDTGFHYTAFSLKRD